ncbi:MAG: hypothetical protein RJB39_446 [Candidatus Parcubacteria bacterium]|jgi:hypothetical protein
MSTNTRIKTIQSEIERINQEIDMKILRGLSYKKESKHHKFLLTHLSDILKNRGGSRWFAKAAHVMSSFLL